MAMSAEALKPAAPCAGPDTVGVSVLVTVRVFDGVSDVEAVVVYVAEKEGVGLVDVVSDAVRLVDRVSDAVRLGVGVSDTEWEALNERDAVKLVDAVDDPVKLTEEVLEGVRVGVAVTEPSRRGPTPSTGTPLWRNTRGGRPHALCTLTATTVSVASALSAAEAGVATVATHTAPLSVWPQCACAVGTPTPGRSPLPRTVCSTSTRHTTKSIMCRAGPRRGARPGLMTNTHHIRGHRSATALRPGLPSSRHQYGNRSTA